MSRAWWEKKKKTFQGATKRPAPFQGKHKQPWCLYWVVTFECPRWATTPRTSLPPRRSLYQSHNSHLRREEPLRQRDPQVAYWCQPVGTSGGSTETLMDLTLGSQLIHVTFILLCSLLSFEWIKLNKYWTKEMRQTQHVKKQWTKTGNVPERYIQQWEED